MLVNLRRQRPRRRSRAWRALGAVACAIGVLLSLLAIGRVVRAPDPSEARSTRVALAQLAYLEPGLEARADAMQDLFPEGRVFTLALYGLAWVDVGRGASGGALRARALAEARRTLALANTAGSRDGGSGADSGDSSSSSFSPSPGRHASTGGAPTLLPVSASRSDRDRPHPPGADGS